MNQPWRIPLILVLSVVLGAPVLSDMLQSPADLTTAGPQYLAGLALAWLGVTAIARLIERFDLDNRLIEQEEDMAAAAAHEELVAATAAHTE